MVNVRKRFFTLVRYVTFFTVVEEMELRKKNKILAEKMKIEMDQKIEIAAAKITTLQENCRVLDDGIRQKTAKKESLVSRKMQVK
jgi:hypothetical protein